MTSFRGKCVDQTNMTEYLREIGNAYTCALTAQESFVLSDQALLDIIQFRHRALQERRVDSISSLPMQCGSQQCNADHDNQWLNLSCGLRAVISTQAEFHECDDGMIQTTRDAERFISERWPRAHQFDGRGTPLTETCQDSSTIAGCVTLRTASTKSKPKHSYTEVLLFRKGCISALYHRRTRSTNEVLYLQLTPAEHAKFHLSAHTIATAIPPHVKHLLSRPFLNRCLCPATTMTTRR